MRLISLPARKPPPDKRAQCGECKEWFERRDTLLRHIRTKHDETKFPCPHCNQSFSRKDNLERHIQSPTLHLGTIATLGYTSTGISGTSATAATIDPAYTTPSVSNPSAGFINRFIPYQNYTPTFQGLYGMAQGGLQEEWVIRQLRENLQSTVSGTEQLRTSTNPLYTTWRPVAVSEVAAESLPVAFDESGFPAATTANAIRFNEHIGESIPSE
jgi:hypothetical protein